MIQSRDEFDREDFSETVITEIKGKLHISIKSFMRKIIVIQLNKFYYLVYECLAYWRHPNIIFISKSKIPLSTF